MEKQKIKSILKETFDTISCMYDCRALRFFPDSARNIAAALDLQGHENVLDVATGTGHAALTIAGLLPYGRVTAVDFSPGMLDRARRKAASMNIGNVEFVEGDMQELGFPDGLFDVAVCAFGIFFVEDMEGQLSHLASKVRPGGRVAISNFQESYFHPLKDLLFNRLGAYGVKNPPQTWKRIATEEACRRLFEQAGLEDIRVERKNLGYYLDGPGEWWDVVWNAGFRRLVDQLQAKDREQFKREHLQDVEAQRTKDGIWLDVGVLYTVGTKRN